MKSIVALIVMALGLTACSHSYNVRPFSIPPSPPKHVVYKNYTIGAVQMVYVGAPAVRVKDYYVVGKPAFKIFTSSVAFSGSIAGAGTVNYPAGSKLLVTDTINYKDIRYFVAKPKNALPKSAGLLITDNGEYTGIVITWDDDDGEVNVFKACSEEDNLCIRPFAMRFTAKRVESPGVKPLASGFINFDIVYSGVTKNTIRLLYREYTPENMARPAYTQNLTYVRSSSVLRFRKVKIRIIDANNQGLQYVVERDGLSENASGH